jgi:hypothetical protein
MFHGEKMTTYSMTPISNGTAFRDGHSTVGTIVKLRVSANVVVLGDAVWTAPADGNEVKKGDTWLHVIAIDGAAVDGWMAIVHKGYPICDNFKEVVSTPPPVVDPPMFPESFVLTDPSGNKAEYKFVRIVE